MFSHRNRIIQGNHSIWVDRFHYSSAQKRLLTWVAIFGFNHIWNFEWHTVVTFNKRKFHSLMSISFLCLILMNVMISIKPQYVYMDTFIYLYSYFIQFLSGNLFCLIFTSQGYIILKIPYYKLFGGTKFHYLDHFTPWSLYGPQ